jgi:amidohydrolase
MPTVHDHAHALAERTVATRRDLHAHPEIAFQETRTMGVIDERLRALGLAPRTGIGGTGVVAVWDTGTPGRTVLARADMDALPVPDEKTVGYRSQREGWNHACGHDGHVAVLLSVAEVLTARDDLAGRVVFVFQPAEEIVRGAEAMLAGGALDGLTADAAVALHLSSTHPTGVVAVREGPAMAAADSFRLTIHGHGGHAAKPDETVDPVLVAAHLVLALQALVSRETDPVDQSVISVTSVHGGTAFNIIPESVELKGTLRTFDAATRERLKRRIHEVADGVAATFRAAVTPTGPMVRRPWSTTPRRPSGCARWRPGSSVPRTSCATRRSWAATTWRSGCSAPRAATSSSARSPARRPRSRTTIRVSTSTRRRCRSRWSCSPRRCSPGEGDRVAPPSDAQNDEASMT